MSRKSKKTRYSLIAVFRDVAVILAVISTLIGFGPQIIDSVSKLVDTKRRHDLFGAYQDYGVDLFADESYREAIFAFEEALQIRPNDIDTQVWLKKAKLLRSLNDLRQINEKDAEELSFEVEFVLRRNPDDPQIHRFYYVRGNIRYVLGDLEKARASYRKALEIESDYAPALANLGAVSNELHSYEEAIAVLRKALAAGYREESVFNNLVFGLHSSGQSRKAVEIANRGLKLFPTSGGIYNELAIALYKLGRKEESVSALKIAVVMTSEEETDLFVQRATNLAYPLSDLGRVDEALSYLESARKAAPGEPQIYLALANVHRRAGNMHKAVAAYEKLGALGAYPDADDLVEWANLLYLLERRGEAGRILQMAIENWNGDPAVLERLNELAAALESTRLLEEIKQKQHSFDAR